MSTARPLNRLAAILASDDVRVDVVATGRAHLFEQAAAPFETRYSTDRRKVADDLIARERLGSTGLGHGVAIPHARIKGLKIPLAAVLSDRGMRDRLEGACDAASLHAAIADGPMSFTVG